MISRNKAKKGKNKPIMSNQNEAPASQSTTSDTPPENPAAYTSEPAAKKMFGRFKEGNSKPAKIVLLAGLLLFAGIGSYLTFGSKADTGCTQTLSPTSDIPAAVQNATDGSTICLSAGNYPNLTLQGQHTSDVILTNVPGAKVVVGLGTVASNQAISILPKTSHLVIRNLFINGGVNMKSDVNYGASFITLDHNDIAPVGFGIGINGGVNCQIENPPSSYAYDPACRSLKKVTNITVSGNRLRYPKTTEELGVNIQQDAIRLSNFDNVRITANEITNVVLPSSGATIYTVAHNDCLQTFWGGSNLTYDHNYQHDNNCQGFFIKDGDVTNVNVTNNLFVRNRVTNKTAYTIQVFNTHNYVQRNNTNWSDGSTLVRAPGTNATRTYDTTSEFNVFQVFHNGCCSEQKSILTENNSIYGTRPTTFTLSPTSIVNAAPQFMNPAVDDYRLAVNPNGIGVDWKPSDYVYGPLGIDGATTPPPPPPTDTTAPTTSLTAPTAGSTVSATTALTATASDAVGVTKVEFYRGTTKLGEDSSSPYAYSWDTKTVANGSYSLTTKAYDAAGNVGTATAVTVTVNNTTADTVPPTVTIASPASGNVSGNVAISASATDNIDVVSIEIYIDGVLYASSSSDSITTSWNTKPKKWKNTTPTITVKAKDAAGNIGTKSVTVTVR